MKKRWEDHLSDFEKKNTLPMTRRESMKKRKAKTCVWEKFEPFSWGSNSWKLSCSTTQGFKIPEGIFAYCPMCGKKVEVKG